MWIVNFAILYWVVNFAKGPLAFGVKIMEDLRNNLFDKTITFDTTQLIFDETLLIFDTTQFIFDKVQLIFGCRVVAKGGSGGHGRFWLNLLLVDAQNDSGDHDSDDDDDDEDADDEADC